MEHIERETLYTDPVYRFQYVAKFMGFGDEDVDVIKGAAELVKPLVPVVVDARHEGFVPKAGVVENAAELTENADQIKFRKDMLSKYFDRLLTNPYDERMIKYLEYVARIHTDTPTKKSKINVDVIHINALLGYVEQVLIGGIKSLNLDRDTEYKAIAAFGKLLWIQMDFFLKFYCQDGAEYLPGAKEAVAANTTTTVAIAQPGILTRLWRFFF
ncbi:hypothetical protein BGZ97_011879 [Linnemannia gamsii]|uniref:Globin-sensor domain-containing protein n=1 Tax=Linnemannia gamsii TaxID=64522 RepID=A0A9P6UMK9_9FUNG|nr:hypothetical protein BGZ97_011879 [Linnemannia gamsii]